MRDKKARLPCACYIRWEYNIFLSQAEECWNLKAFNFQLKFPEFIELLQAALKHVTSFSGPCACIRQENAAAENDERQNDATSLYTLHSIRMQDICILGRNMLEVSNNLFFSLNSQNSLSYSQASLKHVTMRRGPRFLVRALPQTLTKIVQRLRTTVENLYLGKTKWGAHGPENEAPKRVLIRTREH